MKITKGIRFEESTLNIINAIAEIKKTTPNKFIEEIVDAVANGFAKTQEYKTYTETKEKLQEMLSSKTETEQSESTNVSVDTEMVHDAIVGEKSF
jgi:hypothetical protein